MKHFTALISILFVSNLFSEELSDMPQEEIHAMPYNAFEVGIPSLIQHSIVAGVGEFLNAPSPANRVVDISVLEWWTDNPGTNDMLRIHNIYDNETNWIFPTNAPIVFFATATSNVIINTCLGEGLVERMAQEKREQWMFEHVDRSWFRVSRDNGLVYSFTTNLWRHMHASPNFTKQYETLRDACMSAYNEALQDRPLPSWRVAHDSINRLDHMFNNGFETFLAMAMSDPLLPAPIQEDARAKLEKRFCWRMDANGVFCAPDTAAQFLASSNFAAQALAAWRSHDTNNIISFAQSAIEANTTPESLLFRGVAAYYLENDIVTATNLVFTADQNVSNSDLYTEKQKTWFSEVLFFFKILNPNLAPSTVKSLGRDFYLEGDYMEMFWEEHISGGGVFEKFGGEFPFSKTLKYMYNRE